MRIRFEETPNDFKLHDLIGTASSGSLNRADQDPDYTACGTSGMNGVRFGGGISPSGISPVQVRVLRMDGFTDASSSLRVFT